MIKLKDIKTPTTVEEFQENLQKYYFPSSKNGKSYDSLYVKPDNDKADGIEYDKINSFDDIYKITKTGFYGNGSSPALTPMISKESFDLMMKTNIGNMFNKTITLEELFKTIGDIEVYDATNEKERVDFMKNGTPTWIKIENQVMRLFYSKTLGEYSGYLVDGSWS